MRADGVSVVGVVPRTPRAARGQPRRRRFARDARGATGGSRSPRRAIHRLATPRGERTAARHCAPGRKPQGRARKDVERTVAPRLRRRSGGAADSSRDADGRPPSDRDALDGSVRVAIPSRGGFRSRRRRASARSREATGRSSVRRSHVTRRGQPRNGDGTIVETPRGRIHHVALFSRAGRKQSTFEPRVSCDRYRRQTPSTRRVNFSEETRVSSSRVSRHLFQRRYSTRAYSDAIGPSSRGEALWRSPPPPSSTPSAFCLRFPRRLTTRRPRRSALRRRGCRARPMGAPRTTHG